MSRPPGEKFSPLLMSSMGSVGAGIGVLLFSGDWVCSAVGAAFFAAVATPLLDWLAGWVVRRRVKAGRGATRWSRRQQLGLLAGIIAAFIGVFWVAFQWDKPRMFEAALGIAPSAAGVTDLKMERYYGGGPGDMICLIRFRADRATFDRLVAIRPLTREAENLNPQIDPSGGRDWPTFVQQSLPFARLNPSWGTRQPMKRPELYRWRRRDDGRIVEDAILLWDAESGEAYLSYSVG